jgi:signal transduction histidine kinase
MAEPRWPLFAALVGGAGYVAITATGVYNPAGNSAADDVIFLVSFVAIVVLGVVLGLLPRRRDSVIGVVVLIVALQWPTPSPFPAVAAVGFWLVGVAARSHFRLGRALRVRAFELESGRELFIDEAVRYERSRIARELHDIVAHSLSVIVIQASAGQRLPPDDPSAPELLETIAELTGQVREDLDGLARLMDVSTVGAPSLTRRSIDDLLSRTAATGSPLTSNLADGLYQLPGGIGAIVYRVLQEGLTNAIKHAPGAPIDVTVALTSSLYVAVTNQASRARARIPAVPGSGRGLAGLAERVNAANGTFASEPTADGGWEVRAELSLQPVAVS